VTEDRAARARALLAGAGIEAEVEVVGGDGEVAAIRARAEMLVRLTQLAPAVRALGFRYVALELEAGTNHAGSS
jgi:hypothetical protein